ncbi:hypothetical protein D3C71_1936280 [compost metagenome]
MQNRQRIIIGQQLIQLRLVIGIVHDALKSELVHLHIQHRSDEHMHVNGALLH